MPHDYDATLSNLIEHYYKLYVEDYENKMKKANDKAFSYNQYLSWTKMTQNMIWELSGSFKEIILTLDPHYKLGNDIDTAIEILRTKEPEIFIDNPSFIKKFFQSIQQIFGKGLAFFYRLVHDKQQQGINFLFFQTIQLYYDWNNMSNFKLVDVFARYKAFERFNEYMVAQVHRFDQTNAVATLETEQEPELIGKGDENSEFTTARQVLAIHIMLKYMQVNFNNIDYTDEARFIQFLTGKNYDNIYKRVRKVYSENEKVIKKDLLFIRKYFESFRLNELVKMINNDMNAGV